MAVQHVCNGGSIFGGPWSPGNCAPMTFAACNRAVVTCASFSKIRCGATGDAPTSHADHDGNCTGRHGGQ
eukprot:785188-Prorocentrum_lima.AAC.1